MGIDFPQRRSIRLPGYDYSQNGAYFVTLCAKDRECLFGKIVDGEMVLNNIGETINQNLLSLPNRFSVTLREFVIMPNHLHVIIYISNSVGVSFMKPAPINQISKSCRHMGLINQTPTIGHIVRYFKSKCSYTAHKNKITQIIWQRNYYEHIIRGEADMNRIEEYIQTNTFNWRKDKLFIP